MRSSNTSSGSLQNRRQYLTALGAVSLTGIAGCLGGEGDGENGDGGNGNGGGGDVQMTLASSYEPGHILVEAAEDFKAQMEEETDGQFTVEVVAGGAYGGEEDHAELLLEESIHGAAVGTPVWVRYVEDYFIFNVPFSIRDHDHLLSIMQSDVMEEGRENLRAEANHRMIGGDHPWIYRGTRHFTANEPVQSPEDVQGMDLRMPQIDAWVEVWSEIGAQPTPVSLDELYTALQTGTVDASEGPPDQISSFNLNEVQSHYSLTSHHITPGAIYVANEWFEGLDETYQELIQEIGPSIHEEATQTSMDREEDLITELDEAGMEIVEDVDTEAFRDQGEPAVRQLFEENWVVTYDELQEM